MRYGRTVEDGALPVFSVADEEEARSLLTMACSTNLDGEFVARELVMKQSIENLEAFSTRLDTMHDLIIERGRCRCNGSYRKPPRRKK